MRGPVTSESSAPRRRRQFGERSTYILKNPGGFALCVLRAFRKNQGLRIDHILVSETLRTRVRACTIDKAPRKLERPSDHVPVIIDLDWG